jgi:uncharacterized damage-inducible protein DinB
MPSTTHEKWFERVFRFDIPTGRMPALLERLRGTPARIEEKVRGVAPEVLRQRAGETWSVQENIGHLTDLEALHLARLDELAAGATVLRAADLANQRTWAANHNAAPIADILRAFREVRATLVGRLESWDPARLETSALHPRLNVQMRVIDLAYFTAEHDDYHLARMHALLAGNPE